MNIGERIRFLRTQQNLTQDDLAISADTTKQTIHKYETGLISNIPASKIKSIADRLNTTPAFIMGWIDADDGKEAVNKIKIYSMNGEKPVDTIEINEDTIDEISKLVEIATELPKEKIQALINAANAMK